jgi:hypothetical protein
LAAARDYGYKIDAAVCTTTVLPVAWTVRTASEHETTHALPLIDAARERGFAPPEARMGAATAARPGAWIGSRKLLTILAKLAPGARHTACGSGPPYW